MQKQDPDRYLKIVMWARARYSHKRRIVIGAGPVLSPYAGIEKLAWSKYMFWAYKK